MQTHDFGNIFAYLIFFGVLPFVIIGVTSFVKIAVVLSLVRNAIGTQNIPPTMVLNAMAIVLSLYIMMPTIMKTADVIDKVQATNKSLLTEANAIAKPVAEFVAKHTPAKERTFFEDTAKKVWGEKDAETFLKNPTPLSELFITAPAFITSELTKAFIIGFLLFLPFVVIDLVVGNILLALGISTLSPVTISLPIKLLLFIGLDGWQRLFEALVLSYV